MTETPRPPDREPSEPGGAGPSPGGGSGADRPAGGGAPTGGPPGGRPPGGSEPPREGMPTWMKVALGCGGVLLLGVLVLGVFLFLAGRYVNEQMGGIEAQQEATETLERLASEHPFTPPEDGVLGPEQASAFMTVTDEVWSEIEPWARELNELVERIDTKEGEPGLGDMMTGFKSAGRLMQSRLALVEALERHELSNKEYLWSAVTLLQSYEALSDSDGGRAVPEANLELARRHEESLAAMFQDDRIGPGIVLTVSAYMGATDGAWEALELDTLQADLPP